MTRMKGMLLATALMIAAAQSNDPFRTPRRNTGVLVLYRMIESPLNSMYISK